MARLSAKQRREKIVTSAIALFSEKGFSGTTTRALARKAGISEALLFRHFPDKKSLYEAILETKREERIPALLANLPVDKGPGPLLCELALRIEGQNARDPSFLRLLLFSALEGHKLSDLFFQRRTLPVREFLIDYFRKQIQERRLRKIDPETTALAFMAMVFGYIQSRIILRIPQVVRRPSADLLKSYVEIFLKGIEP